VVYLFLKPNLQYLDETLGQVLQHWATTIFAQVQEEQVLAIAGVIGNFGNLINQFSLGQRSLNLELGIICDEITLQVFLRDRQPEIWAAIQNNLAAAYKNRIRSDRAENIEEAIKGYGHALTISTVGAFPLDCLQSSRNLGNLYFSEKQWLKAISTYELAIKAVEACRTVAISDQRRQKIISESIEVFANITQSHIQLNQIDQALTYAERSKARNLIELLASRELYPKGDIPQDLDGSTIIASRE
jgi:tetratricopeptide (TPR) repeat protein